MLHMYEDRVGLEREDCIVYNLETSHNLVMQKLCLCFDKHIICQQWDNKLATVWEMF